MPKCSEMCGRAVSSFGFRHSSFGFGNYSSRAACSVCLSRSRLSEWRFCTTIHKSFRGLRTVSDKLRVSAHLCAAWLNRASSICRAGSGDPAVMSMNPTSNNPTRTPCAVSHCALFDVRRWVFGVGCFCAVGFRLRRTE